jgi:hypothetical protein
MVSESSATIAFLVKKVLRAVSGLVYSEVTHF